MTAEVQIPPPKVFQLRKNHINASFHPPRPPRMIRMPRAVNRNSGWRYLIAKGRPNSDPLQSYIQGSLPQRYEDSHIYVFDRDLAWERSYIYIGRDGWANKRNASEGDSGRDESTEGQLQRKKQ